MDYVACRLQDVELAAREAKERQRRHRQRRPGYQARWCGTPDLKVFPS